MSNFFLLKKKGKLLKLAPNPHPTPVQYSKTTTKNKKTHNVWWSSWNFGGILYHGWETCSYSSAEKTLKVAGALCKKRFSSWFKMYCSAKGLLTQ